MRAWGGGTTPSCLAIRNFRAIQILKTLDVDHCDQHPQSLAIHTTLYIRESSVALHGWMVEVRDRRAKGSRFSQSTLSHPLRRCLASDHHPAARLIPSWPLPGLY